MCFRPSALDLSKPLRCPVCGKINKPDATQCIKCGATEEDMVEAMGTDSPQAPQAPQAPRAPQAPAPSPVAPPPVPQAPIKPPDSK